MRGVIEPRHMTAPRKKPDDSSLLLCNSIEFFIVFILKQKYYWPTFFSVSFYKSVQK